MFATPPFDHEQVFVSTSAVRPGRAGPVMRAVVGATPARTEAEAEPEPA